ncbi:MAG: ATP-binding protein [Armatimonadota bacterium]|nr:ATP-binding protein [Armatimonadota bacterium]MDR7443954.1 ATP-binding protein [Armatimonadota bacterium]MDR7570052.1 ATP-binding protein [Armatimonadota bacterium]MDR7615443.1 ATP-binding protein [Armatimonadota bacterium]
MLRRLFPKLLLAFLVVILAGAVVAWGTAWGLAPAAFREHLATMADRLGHDEELVQELFAGFRRAVGTAVLVAVAASVFVAFTVAAFCARRIVGPVEAVRAAAERVAAGHYEERVPVISQDELGDLAEQFNRMAAALQRLEGLRRDLVADVAHELRTPLAGLAGYLEGMLDGVVEPSEEVLARMQREVRRLERLVEDLQEVSRVEAGQVTLHLRSTSLAEVLEGVLARLRPQFDDKGIELSVELPGDLPRVRADPDRVAQILTNLLGNALRYTPSGGRVMVRAWRTGGEVALAVSDTGIGIPPEHLPHVFDRFYRVDRSRSRRGGGTGIGLTIAKGLVELHGGQIWAESQGPGQGSTFTFTLPAAR